MLINLREILSMADNGGYAVPAFNVYNMETVMGIIEAAEECHSPVILQCYSRLFTNKEAFYVAPMILKVAQETKIPICFHLDHGAGFPEVAKAVRYGCTGVMIDASTKEFEENVSIAKTVSDLCNSLNVPVEGELGHIGSAANGDENASYTEVGEAAEFAERTGVSALAVMVGTAHGHYKKAPVLAIDRIREIKSAAGIPLVLHGGSGVPDDQITASVKAGIRKINFGTDVCFSFLDAVFASDRKTYALDLFMRDVVLNVKKFAMNKMKLLGSVNRV